MKAKETMAESLSRLALEKIKNEGYRKLNAVWIEAAGCSGNIISLLNAKAPDMIYFLREMINLKYNNSIMAAEGEAAYEKLLSVLDTEFILIVDGAVSIKENGAYNIIANYKGKKITGMEAIKLAGEKAKYILAVGTCASHGGISAAAPNPSESISLDKFLGKEVIKLPGCPCHPDWLIGTIAHILVNGRPQLDGIGRPIMFYGITIHDHCTRRSYFNRGIFAQKLGEIACMFKLGCRGPVTRTDCPTRKWNEYVNWPIGDNTPCIGCAQAYFPDGMEPFVRY
ncbi:hydrogenase small subunit [Clostridium swellfunianum]|uniref:hydrogenase small subunit n=1 Tax=Clostridium swellfunianum TaxID=1367462 RepID=UPI00202FC700|nr:hydrogenase small subunit [Clostridium swellfunianum]MCM0650701.1 hydrogenase small subunit [Clostridium swellfunianum]